MMQQQQDAEDITQEVFVAAYENHTSFRGDYSESTWLYRIAMNKCFDQLRKRERQRKWRQLTGLMTASNNEAAFKTTDFIHPGTVAENRERSAMLYKALQKLPVNQRAAWLLCETEHLSYAEIGEVMRLTVPAIESLLFRAKRNLKQILAGFYHSQH